MTSSFWKFRICDFLSLEGNFFCLRFFLSRYNWSYYFLSSYFNDLIYGWSCDCAGFLNTTCFYSVCVSDCINNGANTFLTSNFHLTSSFWKIWICDFLSLESNFFCFRFFLSRYNWSYYFLSPNFNNLIYCWSCDCIGFLNTTCFYSVCVGNCVNDSANTIFTSCFHSANTFS